MLNLFAVTAALLLALHGAHAQGEEDLPPLSYLRHDYRKAAAVAHVEVRKAEVVGRVGGYENWKVTCLVIEPFKGGLRKGAELEYNHGAEAGLRPERLLGERIVFLLAEYDRARAADVYAALENSTLPYVESTVRKLRRIQRAGRRRRPRTGAKPRAGTHPTHEKAPEPVSAERARNPVAAEGAQVNDADRIRTRRKH